MVEVYLFLGPHANEKDFKALESSIKPFIPELTKKKKLIAVIEYGGPPYFPSSIMSYDFAFSDEKLGGLFTAFNKIIKEDLDHFKKHRKGLPNVTSQPFFYLMLNLVLDLNCDLVLEEVTYQRYRYFVRYYHSYWNKFYSEVMGGIFRSVLMGEQPSKPIDTNVIASDASDIAHCIRDSSVLEQVNSLSLKNPEATFLIVRGDKHKDLVLMLASKGFKVIPTFYK